MTTHELFLKTTKRTGKEFGPGHHIAALIVLVVVATLGAVAEVPLRQAVVAVGSGDPTAAETSFSTAQALRWWDPGVAEVAGHAYRTVGSSTGDAEMLSGAERWLTQVGEGTDRPVSALTDLGAAQGAVRKLVLVAKADGGVGDGTIGVAETRHQEVD